MKLLPIIIQNVIKYQVSHLKDLLKEDLAFAQKIVYMICNVSKFTTSVVSTEVYKRYTEKEFPNVQELYETVDKLDHLATGWDELTHAFIGKEFNSYEEIGRHIVREINEQFNPTINLVESELAGDILPITTEEDFV